MSLASSRNAKSFATPASLRKELRHLSREIPSDVVPHGFSHRKVKTSSKVSEKENFRPLNHSATGHEWMRGGSAASPAVFSFSGTPSPPKSQCFEVEPSVGATGSVISVDSSETSKADQCCRPASSVWTRGSAIPRGLMVRTNCPKSQPLEILKCFLQRISSHVTSDALSHLAGILCFWRVLASQMTRFQRQISSSHDSF